MLIVHSKLLQKAEGFTEGLYDFVGLVAALTRVVSLVVDRVHYNKVALRRCVLEECAVKRLLSAKCLLTLLVSHRFRNAGR